MLSRYVCFGGVSPYAILQIRPLMIQAFLPLHRIDIAFLALSTDRIFVCFPAGNRPKRRSTFGSF